MSTKPSVTAVNDPPIARFLFQDVRMAIVWLLVRVYVGWSWIDAGRHKLEDPGRMDTGKSLQAFWLNAVKLPEGAKPPVTFDWYRSFLQYLLDTQSYTWFAKVIAATETLVGVLLIVGAFVGVAAFIGAFLNFNFLLAGTASTNPILFAFAIMLMLGWKTAGWVGVDRWLLPLLGTPWQPIPVAKERRSS